MLIIIISRSRLKLGHVGPKTKLLGQQATQVSDLGPLWPSCLELTMDGKRPVLSSEMKRKRRVNMRIYS